MNDLLVLEEAHLSEENIRLRDDLLANLEKNNLQISAPRRRFWKVLLDFFDEESDDYSWEKRIENETEYLYAPTNEQIYEKRINEDGLEVYCKRVNETARPLPVPKELFRRRGYSGSELSKLINLAEDIARDSYLRIEVSNKLDCLVETNSEILASICRIDLETRIGKNFRGVYPYCGLDVDFPYMMGGYWLLIEPEYTILGKEPISKKKKERFIRRYTKYGEKALKEGRIKLTNSKILNQRRLKRDARKFIPDVILLKCPTPGAEYSDLLEFYKKFVKKNTIIISDTKLEEDFLVPINNIAGERGLNKISTEEHSSMPGLLTLGASRYPAKSLQFYLLKPNQ